MNSSKFLIINADDFGLHPDINSGVLSTLDAGFVRSVSMITNSPYFDESREAISSYSNVSVGIHLNLTDGEPLTSKENLSFLLSKNKKFLGKHLKVAFRILKNPDKKKHIFDEYDKQIEKLKNSGIRISHIDSHGHIHTLFVDLIVELAKKYDIPYVRIPSESARFSDSVFNWKVHLLSRIARPFKQCLDGEDLKYSDHFYGIRHAGHFNDRKLEMTFKRIQPGLTELAVHPGMTTNTLEETFQWNYDWEEETLSLRSPDLIKMLQEQSIELTNFENAF